MTLENFDLSHLPVYIMGEEQVSLYAVSYTHLGGYDPPGLEWQHLEHDPQPFGDGHCPHRRSDFSVCYDAGIDPDHHRQE